MSVTFTATPQQVETAIAPVLPFASTDDHLPTICVVHLEFAGPRLTAVATNRYVMGISTARLTDWDDDYEPAEEGVTVNVFARDVLRLLAFVRHAKKLPATWTIAADRLTVEANGESISVRTVDADFVDWRKVLGTPKTGASETIAALGASPSQLGLFLKVAPVIARNSDATLRIFPGASALSPIIIRIGDTFTGLLMPCRLVDEQTVIGLDVLVGGSQSTPELSAAS